MSNTMTAKYHEDYMLLAIKEAQKARDLGDYPFGAVVVCNDEVVGLGKAENNTTGDVTDHAELLAVRMACKKLGTNSLRNCIIYCTAEPCIMCAAGIFQADIAQVFIGLSRDDLSKFLRPRKIRIDDFAADQSYPIKITKGILSDQVHELFRGVKRSR